jgi:hypothetical protein
MMNGDSPMMLILIQTDPNQLLMDDKIPDPLINRFAETELYILAAILLLLILLAIGLINRRIENMLIFTLLLGSTLIALVLALFQ